MIWNQKKGRVILFKDMGWVEFKFRIWIQKNLITRVQTSNINSKSKRKDHGVYSYSIRNNTSTRRSIYGSSSRGELALKLHGRDILFGSSAQEYIFISKNWSKRITSKHKSKPRARQSYYCCKIYHGLHILSKS